VSAGTGGSAPAGPLRQLADSIDQLNRWIGLGVRWLALLMLLAQFTVVILRYVFGMSYIWATETVLYLHAALFMLGAGYTLWIDAHVRVDIFYAELTARGKAWIDLLGTVFFLFPACAVIIVYSWQFTVRSWTILEGAISVGGIPAAFLLKTLIPLFAGLLIVQGLAVMLRSLATLLEGTRRS